MSNKQFISNLSATYADVRRFDAKKINLKGKNILEYIKEATPTIKHSQDTRETVTENDLWGQWVETTSDGTIIVHDDWVTNPNSSNFNGWNTSITTVEDNKAYISSDFYANIQTEKIKAADYIFNGCTNLKSFASDLSSLTFGESMFAYCSNLESFNSILPSLTDGAYMFAECHALTSFYCDLPKLKYASGMFQSCTNLTSFSSDLSSLTYGDIMFDGCSNLTSFTTDLSSLAGGYTMFANCTNLTSFSSDLSSLAFADGMFIECSKLTSFSSDLPSLIDGQFMFCNCSNLTSFTTDLSSLTNGYGMFRGCKLDANSIMYIADSIKDIAAEKQLYIDGTIPYVTEDRTSDSYKYSAPKGFMSNGNYVYTYNDPEPYTTTITAGNVGSLELGINVTNNSSTIQQQLEDFAKEAYFDSWAELKQTFVDKGWTVTFQYSGTTDAIPDTYDLRNREQIIPCPIFAKLVEAGKDSAKYCTEDTSAFYNIEWGHDVTDTPSYTQFNSLEDAMTYWNVFPKENIITTEK